MVPDNIDRCSIVEFKFKEKSLIYSSTGQH